MSPEVSVVIPCLNEADTLGACLAAAFGALSGHDIDGEVIVADNGSHDGSRQIAIEAGAVVVDVAERGYGSALMAGIDAARGRFIVMGDADLSYDFGEIPSFVAKLRDGFELVQGCRLPKGGGRVLPGAMPLLHRVWGNPMFSALARWWFKAPIHDVYCGLRGFTRELYLRLEQRATGMEFAVEMILKASLLGARIAEVPITLHPDGRRSHPPHLRTFRDGWRTLRFFLMLSPRWLFLMPGLALVAVGLAGSVVALLGLRFGSVTLDAHTLLVANLAVLCGHQTLVFGLLARTFAITEGLLPEDPKLTRFYQLATLETGLVAAVALGSVGSTLLVMAVYQWSAGGFGELDYAVTMRLVIPGSTLCAIALQTLFASFLVSMLGLRRR